MALTQKKKKKKENSKIALTQKKKKENSKNLPNTPKDFLTCQT